MSVQNISTLILGFTKPCSFGKLLSLGFKKNYICFNFKFSSSSSLSSLLSFIFIKMLQRLLIMSIIALICFKEKRNHFMFTKKIIKNKKNLIYKFLRTCFCLDTFLYRHLFLLYSINGHVVFQIKQ